MKKFTENLDAAVRKHQEAIIYRHVSELFKLLPRLSAFRLGPDLAVVDVSACSSARQGASRGLFPLVMQWIVELAECHPGVMQHLGGRIFARGQ